MEIGLSNPRATKAKVALRLSSKFLRKSLWIAALALAAFAVAGIVAEYTLAWLLLTPAVWLAMLLLWYQGELDVLHTDNSGKLSGILDKQLLANLQSESPTGLQLWQALKKTNHATFFAVRYGIVSEFFEQTLNNQEVDTQKVYSQAVAYRDQNGLDTLSSACVFVALFKTIPASSNLLNQLKLDIKELENGISWINHMEHLVRVFSKTKNTGGIGRDWASGYTPLLNQIGHNVTREVEASGSLYRPIESHRTIIQQMIKTLGQTGRANVALVGDTGAGKTTAVYGLADSLIQGRDQDLKYHQVFALGASTLIANTKQRGQLEELVFRLANEAQHAGNIIIFLDEAQLFLEDGTGSVDISNLLMKILQNSRVKIIFTMTPAQWQRISAQNSALVGQINYQLMPPTNREDTIRVLEDQVLFIEGRHKVTLSYYALRETYKLADHYIDEEAFPGKAIKLAEQAAVSAGKGSLVTDRHLQQAIESTRGVKVQEATADESQKLLGLEDELHKQMINQEYAVKSIANALRRARAGTRDTNRPIGAFLFLGPTGVGKTQLAKSLASTYFGSGENIIRINMNEYVNAGDLQRLLAPETGTGNTFIGKIRSAPFSVVLLDEIEKAHQDIINAFLQLLDEGTINDTSGRQASFKDAIIIATSNAGADKIREYISQGREQSDFQQEFIDGIISSGYFKPELINRFDDLLVFRPLKENELVQVLDIMLSEVNKQLGQKKVKVELDQNAKLWLVKKGNDPRLGARPMRRMVQKYVEDAVAKQVLQGTAQPGSIIKITEQDLAAAE
jgi:ATP-dependent Clp protease ATP-binding subunit ClpC